MIVAANETLCRFFVIFWGYVVSRMCPFPTGVVLVSRCNFAVLCCACCDVPVLLLLLLLASLPACLSACFPLPPLLAVAF